MMQVLIPVASRSSFFPAEDYYFPKPLVEVAGQPMIELVVEQLARSLPEADFLFVIDQQDATTFSLDRILQLATDRPVKVITRVGDTGGALCSALLAIDHIDPSAPLLVVNSDQVIDADLGEIITSMEARDATAGVITFDSAHPRWSYVLLDEAGEVVQAAEKRVISRNAIAGFYYFARGADFTTAAEASLLSDASTNGQYFLSATLNEVVLSGGRVYAAKVPTEAYHSFYAPSRIEHYESLRKPAALASTVANSPRVNLVIPASGSGSRFADAGWKRPKPFIDVDGKMMIERVLENLRTQETRPLVILRRDHLASDGSLSSRLASEGATVRAVAGLTEGTACTVLLARRDIDNSDGLIVANSDQLVDFDARAFVADAIARDLDGSILVFRDGDRNTKWSFARLDDEGFVDEVAEKRAISDLATVGIYYFRRGSDFVRGAIDMIAANDRVNGEFYTCPVYNYLIRDGKRIGVFEIPATAMHGLGTPDDLVQYLMKSGAPGSLDAPDSP